jgi:hypothetical protein
MNEVISKLPKVGRFRRNRRLKTDGSASRPYLKFANFEIGSNIQYPTVKEFKVTSNQSTVISQWITDN